MGKSAVVFLLLMCSAALAQQAYPTRPIRLIVPYPPGGPNDIIGRTINDRLGKRLGQQVVIDNRGGAATVIGADIAAHSPADGYTLLMATITTLAVNPALKAKLPYHPERDFAPVSMLAAQPYLLVVHPAVSANSVSQLIAYAKTQPDKLSYASAGVGTGAHLAAELFKHMAQIDVVHVPYKGGGQAAADLLAGHVQFAIESLNVLLPHVQAGRLRALATTGPRRVTALPGVPTMAESGWPQCEFIGWTGLGVPAATPPAIVERLYQAVHSVLASAEARDWFGAIGAETGDLAPEEFAREIRAEHARWGRVIREAGIRLE